MSIVASIFYTALMGLSAILIVSFFTATSMFVEHGQHELMVSIKLQCVNVLIPTCKWLLFRMWYSQRETTEL